MDHLHHLTPMQPQSQADNATVSDADHVVNAVNHELNEQEKSRINELFVASRALVEPLDSDIKSVCIQLRVCSINLTHTYVFK